MREKKFPVHNLKINSAGEEKAKMRKKKKLTG